MFVERVHVIFKGKVQGVWFRANCLRKADRMGIRGWIRNLPDGSVELLAEGEKKVLEKLIRWCSHEQPLARVTHSIVEWKEFRAEFDRFIIIR